MDEQIDKWERKETRNFVLTTVVFQISKGKSHPSGTVLDN